MIKTLAHPVPASGRRDQTRYGDGQAQQDAEPQKNQLDDAEDAGHGE